MSCLHNAVIFASESYLKLYALVTAVAYVCKGSLLPYQRFIFWLEIGLFTVLLLLHSSCLFLSRIEQRVLSAGLLLPSIAGALYFIKWQQYVLRIEVITNSILILLQGLHVISTLV